MCIREQLLLHLLIETSKKTYKVDTDSRDVGLGIGIIGKTEQQTRFTDT